MKNYSNFFFSTNLMGFFNENPIKELHKAQFLKNSQLLKVKYQNKIVLFLEIEEIHKSLYICDKK